MKSDYENYKYTLDSSNDFWLSLIVPGLHHLTKKESLFERQTRIKGAIFLSAYIIAMLAFSIYETTIQGVLSLGSVLFYNYYYMSAMNLIIPNPLITYYPLLIATFTITFILSILSVLESYYSMGIENHYRMQAISLLNAKDREFLRRATEIHYTPDKVVKSAPYYKLGRRVYTQTTTKTMLTWEAKRRAAMLQKIVDHAARHIAASNGDASSVGDIYQKAADDNVIDVKKLLEEIIERKKAQKEMKEKLEAEKDPLERKPVLEIQDRPKDEKPEEIDISEIDDEKTLLEIAKTHEDEKKRKEALSKITDEKMLFDLASEGNDKAVRKMAFHKIKDESLIFELAKTCSDEDVRMEALYDITNRDLLEELSKSTEHSDVKNAAASLLEVEAKDIKELECAEFAGAFKMAIDEEKTSRAFDEILPVWKEKCPSDGNMGFALSASLYFDKSEDTKTIFMNMNDIFHVASQRNCADDHLRSWFVHFAFEYIDRYRAEYRS